MSAAAPPAAACPSGHASASLRHVGTHISLYAINRCNDAAHAAERIKLSTEKEIMSRAWLYSSVLLIAFALQGCAGAAHRPSPILMLTQSDTVAAGAAVVRYAAQQRVGAWAGRAPEVLCVEMEETQLSSLSASLSDLDRSVVPAESCRLHSSSEPPLAPLVRELSTLRNAVILKLSPPRVEGDSVEIDVAWDAGYHYGGIVRCTLQRSVAIWVVESCPSLERSPPN
jgi:hypothetical protein